MDLEMWAIMLGVYVVPCVLAIFLSFRAVNELVRSFLRIAAVSVLVLFAVYILVATDCRTQLFHVSSCGTLPLWFASPVFITGVFGIMFYYFCCPPLLLIALIVEIWTRRAAKFPT